MVQTKTKQAEDHVGASSPKSGLGWLRRTGVTAGTAAVAMFATQANASMNVSPLFDASVGGIYEKSPVSSLDNIPLNIRNVPENPADNYPTSGLGPIARASLNPSDTLDFATLRLGANFNFMRESKGGTAANKWLVASAGMGVDFIQPITAFSSEPYGNSDFAERNYSNAPGTSQRGNGAALTYEQLTYNYYGGVWNNFARPFVFVELVHPLSENVSIGVGAKLAEQEIGINTGWDRYDALQSYQSYSAAAYYTAMPYCLIRFEEKSDDLFGLRLFGSVMAGLSTVLDEQCNDGMSLSNQKFPWFLGAELGVRF